MNIDTNASKPLLINRPLKTLVMPLCFLYIIAVVIAI